MVYICAVVGCGNKKCGNSDVSFYRFPAINARFHESAQELQRKRRQAWISSLRRVDLTDSKANFTRVCSRHFITGKPADLLDVKNPDWTPSVNLGYKSSVDKSSLDRHERATKRFKILALAPTEEQNDFEASSTVEEIRSNLKDTSMQTSVAVVSCGLQTDVTMAMMDNLETELRNLNTERYALQQKIGAFENSEDSK